LFFLAERNFEFNQGVLACVYMLQINCRDLSSRFGSGANRTGTEDGHPLDFIRSNKIHFEVTPRTAL